MIPENPHSEHFTRISSIRRIFKRFLIGEILNDPLSDFDSDAAGINIEDREFHRVSINESRGWQLFDIGLGKEHNFSPASVIVACEDVLYFIIDTLQAQRPVNRGRISKFFKVVISRLIVRTYASRGGPGRP